MAACGNLGYATVRCMLARKAGKLHLAAICPNAPTFVGAFALNQTCFETCKLLQPSRCSRQLGMIAQNGSRKMNTMSILSHKNAYPDNLEVAAPA